jgi:SRSO17 transposase
VLGLLSDLPRKNCWTLAEHAGDANPYGLQHLLSRAKWEADAVRDDIRGFVVGKLHDTAVVLVVDRLYVPRSWTEDTARCQAAGIPDTVGFATKPALAARMIGRALHACVPASWVAGDEVYGGNPHLRTALEQRQVGYVLAVARDHQIATHAGKFRADTLVKRPPRRAGQKLSAGAGTKVHRCYDWALADIADDRLGHHQLLVGRNRRTGELAFYRCHSATHVSLHPGAGRRRHQARSQTSHYQQQAAQA